MTDRLSKLVGQNEDKIVGGIKQNNKETKRNTDKIVVARNCSGLPTRAAKTTAEVNTEQKHEMKKMLLLPRF